MTKRALVFGLLAITMLGCSSKQQQSKMDYMYPDTKIVGKMSNVMWKGELGGSIYLDTIVDRRGLYGLGPESYLTGELLINDGISYVSKVNSDSTMIVEKRFDVSAPFFVYANVVEWSEIDLPPDISTIQELEKFIDDNTTNNKRPFAFKLIGQVSKAIIHIQNLPTGSTVSSPDEAHQGQIRYELINEESEVVGFFSTAHKGIFTHHDSFLHMHLITTDKSKMGHVDDLIIRKMKLYLPKK